jgi:uncharacterized protein
LLAFVTQHSGMMKLLRTTFFRVVAIVLALCVSLVMTLLIPSVREGVRDVVPALWITHINGFRLGYRADYDLKIAMPDGIKLAASLYLPHPRGEKLATVLIRMPYNRLNNKSALSAVEFFAAHGYAVMIQDFRGKYDSEGEFIPYQFGTRDGAATLDWITQQPWSNGKVGTFGCSGLGETQYVLARARHPAHAAMIPLGAGGAMGSAMGRYSYFGVFEGGIFQLASGFGWFAENGAKRPDAPTLKKIDTAKTLATLPVSAMVKRVRDEPNGYLEFITTPLADPWWQSLDYVAKGDVLKTPALLINTWGDQTLGDTLELAEFTRQTAPRQHVVIAPGNHCDHIDSAEQGRFGELDVANAMQPYQDWYLRWFDFWLRGHGDGLAGMAPYTFYMMGENRWLTASEWPPHAALVNRWYLDSDGHANSHSGDGRLRQTAPTSAIVHDEFRYDPMNPVPSRGGPMCCTGNPNDRAGPVDQRDIEARKDVLVYTSPVLAAPLRIAGKLSAVLNVSSSARDTDFIARLVHVWPDGRATNIQEGALRARYRNGIDRPTLLEPDKRVELVIDMRSIAYRVPAGHRLRLDITSSSFPRLERNLNTGGRNFDEVAGVVAINRVHHDIGGASYLEMSLLPDK